MPEIEINLRLKMFYKHHPLPFFWKTKMKTKCIRMLLKAYIYIHENAQTGLNVTQLYMYETDISAFWQND